ncbi:ThuA domain-containing protein [Microbacterium sp. DT81.1]|uniref:ThuA domain-containing protein n=1 Tax=Microbacterium sp. DT81.1 TaxID=3393413 RepID=UPI003CF64D4B
MTQRTALIVRGGWDQHHPVAATERFVPFLEKSGFTLRIEDSPEIYADEVQMGGVDLVVQCVTMSQASGEAVAGLQRAIAAGTGFVGWHGGIADSFRASAGYLQLVGGQFAAHPSVLGSPEGEYAHPTYRVEMTDAGREHPITAGLDDFELTTEQYWVLSDDLNDVLATTTIPTDGTRPWHRPITSPAVWTRAWGAGRVVVATPGHEPAVLDDANVRTIIERGMLWAARTK